MKEPNPKENSSSKDVTNDKIDEKSLEDLEKVFANKINEYPSKHAIAVAVLSVVVFSVVFLGLALLFNDLYSLLESQDSINKQFATIVSLSLTAGLIPPIIYAMSRLVKTKQRNSELASINVQIRNYRNRMLSTQQKEAFERMDERKAKGTKSAS